jgi:hypothetical protein
MLHQSYIHGSECGWKTHFKLANERLRASYDQQHLKTLLDMSERCQEYHEAGIQEERERWESARASQVNVATQIDPATTSISVQTDSLLTPTPATATASVQTFSPIIPPSSSASISTQTGPPLSTVIPSEPSPLPVLNPPIPATIFSTSLIGRMMPFHFRLYPLYPQNSLVTYPACVHLQKIPFHLFVVVTNILNVHNYSLHVVIPIHTQLIRLFIIPHQFATTYLIGIVIHASLSSAMF